MAEDKDQGSVYKELTSDLWGSLQRPLEGSSGTDEMLDTAYKSVLETGANYHLIYMGVKFCLNPKMEYEIESVLDENYKDYAVEQFTGSLDKIKEEIQR